MENVPNANAALIFLAISSAWRLWAFVGHEIPTSRAY